MKILVTGGAGFIGSNLADELAKKHEVVIVDDLSTGRAANVENLDMELVQGSITDMALLKENFRDVDYVFHQAALPSVQRSVDDPVLANEVNVCGTLNVLVAARDADVKKVIYASSSSVYGDTPTLPKREDMKPDPRSPYAIAKLTGEYYCRVFNEIYGLKTVALRYFNVYGPRQDPSSDYAAVIPKFVNRIMAGRGPTIYGDGEQTRDFTFVRDVVQANVRAMESNATGVFNVAAGQRISVNALAGMIMEIIGKRVDCVHEEPRAGDVRDSLGDISRARTGFGYAPRYGMVEGLSETIGWFGVRG
ncbi:MAG: ADP-L-glycero-D-manno-heptose-6-epimerase [Candidatus Argoarchaeum ethanivorans]|uniref:ADP-L-glycero-D-manno-heptose-6-epimerase n=1 Tax=Candidatus Argoarchaeum ethanivorans TaxID=2608793 RepID=A0A811T650_9EURY|nr:MAG: ADP-L-glycero-D-manno-heptose-6-epimerase [Candidatus Argoarchaeum ethanivorans]